MVVLKLNLKMVDYNEPALQNNADASWYTKGLGGVVPKYGVEPAFLQTDEEMYTSAHQ